MQALASRLAPLLEARLPAAAPETLLRALEAAADLQAQLAARCRPGSPAGGGGPSGAAPELLDRAWLGAWMDAARPHLAAVAPAELEAAAARLRALGAPPRAAWLAAAAAALAAGGFEEGEEGAAATAACAAQLLAWAAVDADGGALEAALGALVPCLRPAALAALLRAVDALPAAERAGVQDGVWGWLRAPPAAEGGQAQLDADQLNELLWRLPPPADSAATLAAVRARWAPPAGGGSGGGGSSGSGVGSGSALGAAADALEALAGQNPDAALDWAPEAFRKAAASAAAASTGGGNGDSGTDADADTLRACAVLDRLEALDAQRVFAAAAPASEALAAGARALGAGAFLMAAARAAALARGALQLAALAGDDGDDVPRPAPGARGAGSDAGSSVSEQWAEASAAAARAWARPLSEWAAEHADDLDGLQLVQLLCLASELHAGAAAGGPQDEDSGSSGGGDSDAWVDAADEALRRADDAGAVDEAACVAAAAALARLRRAAPAPATLEAALAAAARCQLALNAAGLCDALALLERAAAARGAAGLPSRHVLLANSVCTSLAAKGPGAAVDARGRLQTTLALLALAARGGGGGVASATAAALDLARALGTAVTSSDGGRQDGSSEAAAAAAAAAAASAGGWSPPAQAARWALDAWAAAARDAPAACAVALSAEEAALLIAALADCAALASAAGRPADEETMRRLQPLLASAAAKTAAAPRTRLPPAAAAGAAVGLLDLLRRAPALGGDAALQALAARCLEGLAARAAAWPLAAQLRLLAALGDGASGSGSGSDAAVGGAADAARDAAQRQLLAAATAVLDQQQTGGADSGGAGAADLLAALHATAAAGASGGGRLPRRAAQRLLGIVRAGLEEAPAAGAGGAAAAAAAGWPADAALQYVQACCRHGVAPAPPQLSEALRQAATAPPGALAPTAALQLLLLLPKAARPRRGRRRQAAAAASGRERGAAADRGEDAAAPPPDPAAVQSLLARHLQPSLGRLTAAQLHRLVVTIADLGAPPPPGFAAAAAAALAPRLELLPKGRHLLTALQQLLAWGHRPSAEFMAAAHRAAGLLLDSLSGGGCLELLGACWEAARPGSTFAGGGGGGNDDAAAANDGVPLPPRPLVADVLRALEARALAPDAACEGLRLLATLRLRPAPALLLRMLDAARRGGVLRVLPGRLLLAALWGCVELRVAPPAGWLDDLIEALCAPGRAAACAPATLAGLLRCLSRLGARPAPALAAAAVEAAAAAAAADSEAGEWDAESLSVVLVLSARFGALGTPAAVRAAAARAAELSQVADGASAARLFLWWQQVRASDEAERLLGAMAPEEAFAVDVALWGATMRCLPDISSDEAAAAAAARRGLECFSGAGGAAPGRAALPRAALAPVFLAGAAAALRPPAGAPPAWLDAAWRGGAAAAAAADSLSAAEAAAMLVTALGRAPTAHLWDLGVAQAVLRAGYRGRAGAPPEALAYLGLAGELMGELVDAAPPYAESWAAALEADPSLAADGSGGNGGGAPGLPQACAEELSRALAAAEAAEAAQASGAAFGGGDGGAKGVAEELDDLVAAVAEDVSPAFVALGFDD